VNTVPGACALYEVGKAVWAWMTLADGAQECDIEFGLMGGVVIVVEAGKATTHLTLPMKEKLEARRLTDQPPFPPLKLLCYTKRHSTPFRGAGSGTSTLDPDSNRSSAHHPRCSSASEHNSFFFPKNLPFSYYARPSSNQILHTGVS